MSPLSQSVIRLRRWEEYIGTLTQIERDGQESLLHFKNGDSLSLPVKVDEELQEKIGEKLAVIRTDIPNKEYLWRKEEK